MGGIGIGDDCALLPEGLLATMDTLVESVHFKPGTPVEALAFKLLGVNVSDIAAMGGTPRYALLSLGCGKGFDAQGFMQALQGFCASRGVSLVGGDTVSSPVTALTLTLLGTPGAVVARRSAAKPGDVVCVSGPLGGAVDSGRHLSPPDRSLEGRRWVELGMRCLMDLSDGLSQGLHAISRESSVAVTVDASKVPLHPATAGQDASQRLLSALHEGEDFELLGTCSPEVALSIAREFPGTVTLGAVRAGQGVFMGQGGREVPLVEGGYEHRW